MSKVDAQAKYVALVEELAKHLTTGRNKTFWFMFEPLMISKDVFASLSKAQQDVVMAVGGQGYMQMKVSIADAVMQRMPDTMKMMESYAADAMRIRETLVDRMQLLTGRY